VPEPTPTRKLAEAHMVLESSRQEYHTGRPHRGLAQRTPVGFAVGFTPEQGPASPLALRS